MSGSSSQVVGVHRFPFLQSVKSNVFREVTRVPE